MPEGHYLPKLGVVYGVFQAPAAPKVRQKTLALENGMERNTGASPLLTP